MMSTAKVRELEVGSLLYAVEMGRGKTCERFALNQAKRQSLICTSTAYKRGLIPLVDLMEDLI